MKFGDYLRQTREKNGWTQPEAAAKAGIEQSYLSKLETGKSYPSEEIFTRITTAYGINPKDLTSSIFSAELDKLREIGEVRNIVLTRQQSEARFMRGWLIAGLIMLMLGGGMLGLAYTTNEPERYKYHYRSEGIILDGESPMVFQLMEAGLPDRDGTPLTDRIDYDFQIHSADRGMSYIEQVEGGYRKYSRHHVEPDYRPSLITWHYSLGFMFVIGGLGCFYISRRWR